MTRKSYSTDLADAERVLFQSNMPINQVLGRKRSVDLREVLNAIYYFSWNGTKILFEKVKECFPRLKLVWADGGYAGKLVDYIQQSYRWIMEIVS